MTISQHKKTISAVIILLILISCSIIFCSYFGAVKNIDKTKINKVIFEGIFNKKQIKTPIYTIIWQLRIPRIILAALIGACLSMSGAAFQGLLRNPLADPYIVGTSAGAALGGVLAIVFKIPISIFGLSGIVILAFIGALISMYTIYRLSGIKGRVPVETFLLAGVVVGSFLWAMVSFILTISGKNLHEVIFWLMGSTQGATWQKILLLSIYTIIGYIGLQSLSYKINILTLGDETAEHLGLNVEKIKFLILLFASILTAAAVSVSGLIGFIGLMIPHVVRIIIGADHRKLIPISALSGALFLMIVDTVARSLSPPGEIPVGILTAILGAPFFLYLLRKRKLNL